jgi:hypothetical protein
MVIGGKRLEAACWLRIWESSYITGHWLGGGKCPVWSHEYSHHIGFMHLVAIFANSGEAVGTEMLTHFIEAFDLPERSSVYRS